MKISADKNYRYQKIAGIFEKQILTGLLKNGDKLPSVRETSEDQGVSINTVTHAYLNLESKSLVESRPKSGFYVSYVPNRNHPVPAAQRNQQASSLQLEEELISRVYESLPGKDLTMFSLGFPAEELLPIDKLNKGMIQLARNLPASGTGYEPVQGNEKLRIEVARLSFSWGGNVKSDDIVTTSGCISALSHCLIALTQAGDTIVVESPSYFGILQLARSLHLNVIELPVNLVTGIEVEALKSTLDKHKIAACVLISNFNNPIGSLMPDEHKKEVVRLLEHHNVPLIEDDIYGDLYFGDHRPSNCKTYDESGIVLCCSSVSKTIAPGYRVGWVSPGKYKDKIIRTKLYHALSSTNFTQEIIADFLKNGRYENHLRKFRAALHSNYLNYVNTITEYFPKSTLISKPQGGFFLWLEFEEGFDTVALYELAMKYQISIAPGRIFSLQKQYQNCIRLNFGMYWDENLRKSLQLLGSLVSRESSI